MFFMFVLLKVLESGECLAGKEAKLLMLQAMITPGLLDEALGVKCIVY